MMGLTGKSSEAAVIIACGPTVPSSLQLTRCHFWYRYHNQLVLPWHRASLCEQTALYMTVQRMIRILCWMTCWVRKRRTGTKRRSPLFEGLASTSTPANTNRHSSTLWRVWKTRHVRNNCRKRYLDCEAGGLFEGHACVRAHLSLLSCDLQECHTT